MAAPPTHVALVLSEHGKIAQQEVPTRSPVGKEILVEILYAGICGTDLQIVGGVRPDRATILGHEGIGRILRVGEMVTKFCNGDLVIFNPVNPRNQDKILGHSTEGIFQQHFLVTGDAEDDGLLVPFDLSLPLICGPLVEPLGTVIYGQTLGDIVRPAKRIAVIGAGPIGLLHVMYAKLRNYSKVFLVHNSEERLKWAVEHRIVKPEDALLSGSDLESTILRRTGGQGVDSIFLCTTRPGAFNALRRSLGFLRDGGCVDLMVGFPDGDTIVELPQIDLNAVRRANHCGIPEQGVITQCRTVSGKEVWLTGHRGTSQHHLLLAMDLLRDNYHRFLSIISHIASLQATPLLLEQLSLRRNRCFQGEEVVKVIVDFNIEGSQIQTAQFS